MLATLRGAASSPGTWAGKGAFLRPSVAVGVYSPEKFHALAFKAHSSCRAYTAFVGCVHTHFFFKQHQCLKEKVPEVFSHAVTCLAAGRTYRKAIAKKQLILLFIIYKVIAAS